MVTKSSTQLTLQELRRQAGISQRKLAAQAGVDRANLVRAESGVSTLSPEVAMKSAQVLGVDGVQLMIEHNTGLIKSRVESGEEGPLRALNLSKTLLQLIEDDSLEPKHRKMAKEAASELLALVEKHIGEDRNRTIGAASEEETNLSLNRDSRGRPISEREAEQRRADRDAGIWNELGQDDPEWDAEGPRIDQGELGRDKHGRRLQEDE